MATTSPSVRDWVAWIGQGVTDDPDALRFVELLLAPANIINQYMVGRILELPNQVDAARVDEARVRFLAGLVGLDAGLPAAQAETVERLRQLIPIAVALWKRKGQRQSWRDVVASLAFSRALVLDWFHHRTITGSAAEQHVIPAPGSLGAAYSYPEFVSDVWYMDPDRIVDVDAVVRWLSEVRPGNERINLYRADFLDDLQIGASLWTPVSPMGALDSGNYDADTFTLDALGDWLWYIDVGGAEATWTDYHWNLLAAITSGFAGYVFLFSPNDPDEGYRLELRADLSTVTLVRMNAGLPTPLGTFPWGPIAPAHFYRMSFEAFDTHHPIGGAPASQVRMLWEGTEVLNVYDTSGSRHTAGNAAWGSLVPAEGMAIRSSLLWQEPISSTRVGPTP